MENALQHPWLSLDLTTQPPALRGSNLVFDRKRQQAVLFVENETWLWNGTGWRQAHTRIAPPARNTSHLVYDITTECVLLFGGIGTDGTPLHDTWLWDGTTWTQLYPVHHPSSIGGAALACDIDRRQVILVGGIMGFDGSTGSNRIGTFSNTTWLWDGTTWTEQSMSAAQPARVGGQMVYDDAHQQTLLFGGYGSTGYLNDMWLWNGAGWTQLSPAALPPTQTRSYVTFHQQLQQVMLLTEEIGGTDQLQYVYQTWLWNGFSWSQSATEQILPGSIEGFAYDEVRNEIIACVITGDKALLANKTSGGALPNLAVPTLACETWIW